MKKVIKISLISFFLLFTLGVNFCLATEAVDNNKMYYKPEVTFPGFSKSNFDDPNKGIEVTPALLGEYISSLYQYLLYVAGVVAVIVIMIAGFQWITAGGNQSKIGEAKERLTSAIIGLFLALTSYLLLYTINPNLVEIVDLSMPSIMPIDSYCPDDQMVRMWDPGTNAYVPNADYREGSTAHCGDVYKYEVEGQTFECKGGACAVSGTLNLGEDSHSICYEDRCMSAAEACLHACELEQYGQLAFINEAMRKIENEYGWCMQWTSDFSQHGTGEATKKGCGFCWKTDYEDMMDPTNRSCESLSFDDAEGEEDIWENSCAWKACNDREDCEVNRFEEKCQNSF